MKSGLMGGKSIGFLTIKAHAPTDDEVKRRPELRDVRRIVDEWMLLEYCCCWLPINPEAVVEATSKAQVEALGIPFPEITPKALPTFTTLDQFQSAIDRAVKSFDAQKLADKLVQDAVDRMRGRV